MHDVAIRLRRLSKSYRLYDDPVDRLKEAFHPLKKKYYREHRVLTDINLDIMKGEILGVVGRNGSGKSTLLKLISNIIKPNSGTVEVNGKISALFELGGGFNIEFSGLQNITFIATMKGFSRKDIDKRLSEIIEFADIGEYISQPVKTYSSGMKARLSFAIAVHIDPEILILDEVLAVGDELFRRKCFAKMEGYFRSGKTIIYVSHDASSIIELCSRAIFLESGEILLESDPKTVVSYYQKFLHANEDMKGMVRDEIKCINEGTNQRINDSNVYSKGAGVLKLMGEECFIPDLRPGSTVEYRNYKVAIADVCIKSLRNKKANVLASGNTYRFCARVHFEIDVTDVGFSFSIKNEKGLDISTYRMLRGEFVDVAVGDIFDVQWEFLNLLLPGTYFLNIGVRSFPENSESFVLNRIIDVDAFKVRRTGSSNTGGIVSLKQTVSVSRTNAERASNSAVSLAET